MIPVLLLALVAGADFTDVQIDKRFAAYLKARPLLMEVAGAKVVRLKNGHQLVVGVASVPLDDDKPRTRLDAEKVCKARALASIVGERDGVQVAHEEKAEDRTVVVVEDGKEKGKSVSKVMSLTTAKVKGIQKGMEVVGRWRSADGKVFYLAVGAVCDKNGEPVYEKE
ncbi:MAG: hypothetical protein U0797_25105 [Gemmataceae bacterium]